MSTIYTLSDNKFISEASDTFIAVIDGKSISTLNEFYAAISSTLNFPDYFGENLDALDEMLYDLDWIENNSVLLLIKNHELLLQNEPENKNAVMLLFKEIDNPYFEVCFI